ncbi:unnamed protein product [Urochloa humidicola]
MEPCPFVRVLVGNLALRMPVAPPAWAQASELRSSSSSRRRRVLAVGSWSELLRLDVRRRVARPRRGGGGSVAGPGPNRSAASPASSCAAAAGARPHLVLCRVRHRAHRVPHRRSLHGHLLRGPSPRLWRRRHCRWRSGRGGARIWAGP